MESESLGSKQGLDLTDSDMQLVLRWMVETIDGFIDFPLNVAQVKSIFWCGETDWAQRHWKTLFVCWWFATIDHILVTLENGEWHIKKCILEHIQELDTHYDKIMEVSVLYHCSFMLIELNFFKLYDNWWFVCVHRFDPTKNSLDQSTEKKKDLCKCKVYL